MPIIKIADATVEPISLEEAKAHLRVDVPYEDALIASIIKAVRLACEAQTQRTLIETTWEQVHDAFPESVCPRTPSVRPCRTRTVSHQALRLRMPRLLQVLSVKYLDESGVEQTLAPADYIVDRDSEPGYVVPAPGKAWPATAQVPNAVRVRYTAGFGATAQDVPQDIKLWMLLHIGHYFQNREASAKGIEPLPFAEGLLDPYRVYG